MLTKTIYTTHVTERTPKHNATQRKETHNTMTHKPAYINRNPYARQTLYRQTVKPLDYPNTTCSWCGSQSHDHNGKPRLFEYIVSPDTGRDFLMSGAFCSIACMRSYHNVTD